MVSYEVSIGFVLVTVLLCAGSLHLSDIVLAQRHVWFVMPLQPIADAVKMLFKETIIPSGANRVLFIAAPIVSTALALVAWAVIPFDAGVVIANINVGILYLFAISSLSVYGIIIAGWASN